MPICETYQLEMPVCFPGDELDKFVSAANRILEKSPKSEAAKEFRSASNLIGWRFRACYDEMQVYCETWQRVDCHETLYHRERALFGMLCAGQSCLECTCYAISALASHPTAFGIPFGERERKNCGPSELVGRFRAISPQDHLCLVLDEIASSARWNRWRKMRNRVSHRSNMPREIYASNGADAPSPKVWYARTSSSPRAKGDVEAIQAMFAWLAVSLHKLLFAACTQFAQRIPQS